jgi:tetratricopeptide (TPR) repeat protein
MHNKGVLEMANGIFKYAVYYFKEAADIKEALLGPKHNSVLETLEQLAIAMYGMGAYDQSHATLRSIHSRSHSRVLAARTWNAIACLHFQKGEYDFALKCAERAVILHKEKEVMQTIALANQGYMQLIGDIKEGRKTLKVADEVRVILLFLQSHARLVNLCSSPSISRGGSGPTTKSLKACVTI